MKLAILFDSPTGNTRQVAEAIHQACSGHNLVAFGPPQELPQGDLDLIFVGSWTDKGSPSQAVVALGPHLAGKTVALFGTAGFGGSQAYFDRLAQRFKEALPQSCRVLGSFYCQGKMPLGVRQRYQAMVEANPEDAKAQASLANFDAALSHPYAQDLDAAGAWAQTMLKACL